MAQNDPNDANAAEQSPLARMPVPHLEDPAEQPQADLDLQLWEAEEQARKLQPTFANRAYVKIEGHHLRIAFGERVSDEDVYRLAVVMTPEDAYGLGELLLKQAGAAYSLTLDHYRQVLEGLKTQEEPNG